MNRNVLKIPNVTSWQTALSLAVTDPAELLALLELDPSLLPEAKKAAALFPLKVPHSFIARMEKQNPHDPLLKQVLPLGLELKPVIGYSEDPLKESLVNPLPGLLHKYHGRVLVTLVGACGVHCRYCFRRHFPYEKNNPGSEGWDAILSYIAKDTSISEVILSGGDPLVASDKVLQQFTEKLQAISHVTRLRIHSRMPIVQPERITPSFIQWIKQVKQPVILVTHCNHPNEIDTSVIYAMQQLREAKVTLFNQSVLLKTINDDVETLATLSERLWDAGILPYYLHALDKVEGSAHFDIPLENAKHLYAKLNERLSGYLVPKFVYEKPGALAKLPMTS